MLRMPSSSRTLSGITKICLAQGDARADMRQLLARVFDRFGILIEREHIRAGFQHQLGMTAAAAGAIDHERAGTRGEQFDRFCRQTPADDK